MLHHGPVALHDDGLAVVALIGDLREAGLLEFLDGLVQGHADNIRDRGGFRHGQFDLGARSEF